MSWSRSATRACLIGGLALALQGWDGLSSAGHAQDLTAEELQAKRDSFASMTESLSSEEIPNLRIGWHFNEARGAFAEAQEKKLPAVFVMGVELCVFCKNLLKNMTCPEVSRLASHMVFNVSYTELDPSAAELEHAFGVVRFPTVLVLSHVTNPGLHITGRIEGEVDASEIERVLLKAGVSVNEGMDADLLEPEEVASIAGRLGLDEIFASPESCPSLSGDQ